MSRPNIYLTAEVEQRLRVFIDSQKTEIGGFGHAWMESDGSIVVNNVFLVPQTVSGSEVDFGDDGEGLAVAIERFADDGVLGTEGFIPFSWHSHHTMNAFWSGTDEDCIRKYGLAGATTLLSYVGTHKREYKCRLDFFKVEHHGLTIPQVTMDDLTVLRDNQDPVIAAAYAEIDRNVTVYKPKAWTSKPKAGPAPVKPVGPAPTKPVGSLPIGERLNAALKQYDDGMTLADLAALNLYDDDDDDLDLDNGFMVIGGELVEIVG